VKVVEFPMPGQVTSLTQTPQPLPQEAVPYLASHGHGGMGSRTCDCHSRLLLTLSLTTTGSRYMYLM